MWNAAAGEQPEVNRKRRQRCVETKKAISLHTLFPHFRVRSRPTTAPPIHRTLLRAHQTSPLHTHPHPQPATMAVTKGAGLKICCIGAGYVGGELDWGVQRASAQRRRCRPRAQSGGVVGRKGHPGARDARVLRARRDSVFSDASPLNCPPRPTPGPRIEHRSMRWLRWAAKRVKKGRVCGQCSASLENQKVGTVGQPGKPAPPARLPAPRAASWRGRHRGASGGRQVGRDRAVERQRRGAPLVLRAFAPKGEGSACCA